MFLLDIIFFGILDKAINALEVLGYKTKDVLSSPVLAVPVAALVKFKLRQLTKEPETFYARRGQLAGAGAKGEEDFHVLMREQGEEPPCDISDHAHTNSRVYLQLTLQSFS